MQKPLMHKATALWLVRHTGLTFQQIADFCGLHILEVEAMADDLSPVRHEQSPIVSHQLTQEEIDRCTQDPQARLCMKEIGEVSSVRKHRVYTPLSKRHERPSAILWLLRNCPHITNAELCKFMRTTKNTVQAVRDGTHWNSPQLTPQDPVILGLCSQEDLDTLIELDAQRKEEKQREREKDATESSRL